MSYLRKYPVRLSELICPLFVKEGKGLREKIPSMPGVYRFSPDILVREVIRLKKIGLENFLIFGVPDKKDSLGTTAYKKNSVVSNALKAVKSKIRGVTLITDICLCAYTSHGHCGILIPGHQKGLNEKRGLKRKGNFINKRATLKALSDMACLHAFSGADIVAPSAMIDGQVRAIRRALDKNGYRKMKIMAYSAKFSSNFYGPFRDIADSYPRFGDRSGYQLDYADSRKALIKIKQDIGEGADIVMVKPALSYLDIVRGVKDKFNCVLSVYNVSGEYSMVKQGSRHGFWDEKKIVAEIMSSIKRAGADLIITYHARDIAEWILSRNW